MGCWEREVVGVGRTGRMVCLGVADVYGVDLWVLCEKFGLGKGFWGDSGGPGGLWKVQGGQEGGGGWMIGWWWVGWGVVGVTKVYARRQVGGRKLIHASVDM